MLQDVPLGLVGYTARAVTFLGVGVLVGLQSEQRLRLQREREGLLAELQATTTHDQLTGLPTGAPGTTGSSGRCAAPPTRGQPLSVLAIDLDGLKRINNTHGHAQGDRLLQRCAHAWNGALRDGDFLARLGGDEFLVLLPGSAHGRGRAGGAAVPRRGALQPDLLDRRRDLGRRGAGLRARPPRRSGHVRGQGGGRRARQAGPVGA